MKIFTRIISILLVDYSRETASLQMFHRVLSTSLKFVLSVSYIVVYLVVSRHTHLMGIDYLANF